MDDKPIDNYRRPAPSKDTEEQRETAVLDADSLTKETLASSNDRSDADSYRDVLRRLSDTTAEVASASGEFGSVFNVRALVGKTLAKKYEITERIGRGGMGTVFKARDLTLERDVAVKVLNPSLSDDELSLNRFLREAKMVSRLKHPNAISLYEFGVEGAVPYLVMEFVEGISLEKLIVDEGPLDIFRANLILQQVCAALHSAHELGILHRDLKPDNIMVSRRSDGFEFVQVLDFGMAKVLGAESEKGPKVSSTGVPCGTPHYMAPELITAQDVDLRADIYALGIIAYQMLVGKTPFEDFSTVEILYHQFHTVPPLVTEANPSARISRGIEKAVARAMEKNPTHRFQSVLEFADTFSSHVNDDFIFISGSQSPKVIDPYRSPFTAPARRFRTIRNPFVRFWLAWFFITALTVTVVWTISRYHKTVNYYTNVGLLYVESVLHYRLEGWRQLAKLSSYGTVEEAFAGAASNQNVSDLGMYIASGGNLDVRDEKGDSLLHYSVYARHSDALQRLLDADVNLSPRNKAGETPLMHSAKLGLTGFVHALATAGASVDAKDELGKTALMHASEEGHLSSIHALLLQRAAINTLDESGRSALIHGVSSGDPDVLRFLIDQGAFIDQKDQFGRTALFYAVSAASAEMVQALAKRGADLEAVAQGDITALMYAVSKGEFEIARLLVHAGADPERRNSLGVSIKEMVRLQGDEAYRRVFGKSPD